MVPVLFFLMHVYLGKFGLWMKYVSTLNEISLSFHFLVCPLDACLCSDHHAYFD